MKEINNLIYTLEINYTTVSGLNASISIKLHDSGLKIKSIRVGNVCITEETINGRILSGRLDTVDGYCGYKFDYRNGEKVLKLNPNISINTATSLIDKKKKESDFTSAEFVLSSISRNDYRVVALNKGKLNITKIVSAENEKLENCRLQESIDLLKLDGDDSFVEQHKRKVYEIDNKSVVEEAQTVIDSDIKSQLYELTIIISQSPHRCKDLIELKNQIQQGSINKINEEKCHE